MPRRPSPEKIDDPRSHFDASLHYPTVPIAAMMSASGDALWPRMVENPQTASSSVLIGGDLEDQRLYSSIHRQLFGSGDCVYVGRYRIEGRLGAGAMGQVYLAYDASLDRDVAVKLVHAHLTDTRQAQRLRREAKALARLAHPNVVRVYEVGEHEGQVFLAMEYVQGRNLRTWIRQAAPSWSIKLDAYRSAGRGLAAAHRAGLTHRDFKPDNVLRGDDGRILVADFGLALLRGSCDEAAGTHNDLDPRVTHTGEVGGTPAYMPPEQSKRAPVDARADQYSFCVALYEALWGRRPFTGRTAAARILEAKAGPPAPSSTGGVPRWVWPVIARGLAYDADERWPSMDALLEALERGATRRRRWRRRLVLGLTGVVAGLAGLMLQPSTPAVDFSCPASEALDSSWNPEARRSIEQAFARPGLPSAEHMTPRVIGALDGWYARWVEANLQLGDAKRLAEAPRFVERRRCLDRRRGEFVGTVAALASTTPESARHALDAIDQLGEPERCMDPSIVAVAPAPPLAQREAVDGLEIRLGHVEALVRTARYAEAQTALEQLQAPVESTRHDPLRARWFELSGRALAWGGDPLRGTKALERAADLADRGQDDGRRADAWRYLAQYALSYGRDVERGAQWLKRAETVSWRLGIDPARSGELATIRGHHGLLTGDFAQAEAEFEVAIADFQARGRRYRVLNARRGLGDALSLRGQPARALHELRLALSETEQVAGPHHPLNASIAYDIAAILIARGEADSAQEMLERALDVWLHGGLEDHGNAPIAMILLANADIQAERFVEAAATLDEAEALLGRTRPEGHPDFGDVASARAANDYAWGRFEGAVEALDEAIAIYREALGPDDPYLAKVTADRGWARLALHDIDGARQDFASAEAISRDDDGALDTRTRSLLGLAVIAESRRLHDKAREWLDRIPAVERDSDADLLRAVIDLRTARPDRAHERSTLDAAALARAERTGIVHALDLTTLEIATLRDP